MHPAAFSEKSISDLCCDALMGRVYSEWPGVLFHDTAFMQDTHKTEALQ